MSRYKSDPEISDYESTKCCTRFLHYTWKTITCLFSHVTLVSMVVSYCVLGAFTFEALEVENEREIKRGIYKIRENVTNYLWNFTLEMRALEKTNFTIGAIKYLKAFEHSLLDKMNKEGWDGEEDPLKVQWTRTGALFYSIIVITTIDDLEYFRDYTECNACDFRLSSVCSYISPLRKLLTVIIGESFQKIKNDRIQIQKS